MAQGVLTSRRRGLFYPFALCFARPCNTASLLFGRFRLAVSVLSIHKTGIDIRPPRLRKPPATRPLTSLQDAVCSSTISFGWSQLTDVTPPQPLFEHLPNLQ